MIVFSALTIQIGKTMNTVRELLCKIGQFHRAVRKALVAKRDRSYWIEQAAKEAAAVRDLLRDPQVSAALDELFSLLHAELNDPQVAKKAANAVSQDLAGFIRAEARLHQLTHIDSKIYADVVDEVQPWIMSSVYPDFPKTTAEFLNEFDRVNEEFRQMMSDVPKLNRSLSKASKGEFGWKFWRYSVGTLMTVANVFFSYHQPSFSGIGMTSVTVGAWYFNRRNGGPRKPPVSHNHGSANAQEVDGSGQ